MKSIPKVLLIMLGIAFTINVFAQAPNITFSAASVKVTGAIPFSISPSNTGGAVPAKHYGLVSTFAGDTSNLAGTMGYVNANGTSALFNNPQDMAFDAAGNMYLTDAANNAIRKITPDGTVSTYAGSTTGVAGLADGQGTSALFNFPDGLAFDAAGNLFVADFNNAAIRKITPDGSVSTFYTSTTDVFSPTGMCFDASGNLVIALQYNFEVVKLSPTAVLSVVAGIDYNFQTPAGVVPDSAILVGPTDVKMDKSGNLIIVDGGGYQIEKITPDGKFSLFAGNRHSTLTYGNGIGSQVGLAFPAGIQIMQDGSMYITEIQNNDIRKMLPDGTVSAFSGVVTLYPAGDPNAGSAIFQPGFMDGPLSTAQYYEPAYPRADNNGDLYVSEWGEGGNRIRKIIMTGYSLNGTLPAGLVFDATTGNLSGTVTTPFAAVTDTITAHNISGSSSAIATLYYQPVSTIATLASLVPGSGTLNPAFASGTTGYTEIVPNTTNSIAVTPTTTDTTATVTVNGVAVASGTASAGIPLSVGNNVISTVVTASDGVTQITYTLTVNRLALSTNANLAGLVPSLGVLTPAFAAATTSYADNLANSHTSINIQPTTADPTATVTVNGALVTSGTYSAAIPLAVGANAITVIVTAQDGVTKTTYTLTVNRAAPPSTNANLASLVPSLGGLTPAFSAATSGYTVNLANSHSSITVQPTLADPTAKITVNGTAVPSGASSTAIPLAVGANVISVNVTAQDGVTMMTYTITVNRAAPPSTNANLANLVPSLGGLTPAFATTTTSYTDNLANSHSSIAIQPTVADPTAIVTVNGAAVTSGAYSAAIPLTVGANAINVVVTAQDGVTKTTYTLTVNRAAAPSTNANLANLVPSLGGLTPAFSATTISYTDNLASSHTSITVQPFAADPTATITVNGTAVTSGTSSQPIPLAVGGNVITTVVTAQDGITKTTYTLTVNRAAPPSTNANLANLIPSLGGLTPAFSAATTSYADNLANSHTSITIMPIVADVTAKVTVNGATVTSGTASAPIALAVGNNVITTVVTAQDGATTMTYTLTVNRALMFALYVPADSLNTEITTVATDGIVVHPGLSPNGDGINDIFTIDGINAYPENKVTIMSRSGNVIFEAKGYDNQTKFFDGHSSKNGSLQLPGTYFYSLEYSVDGKIKQKTGFLVLKY